MINLKKAIADSIMTNPIIYALVGDRVYRKRNDKNANLLENWPIPGTEQ